MRFSKVSRLNVKCIKMMVTKKEGCCLVSQNNFFLCISARYRPFRSYYRKKINRSLENNIFEFTPPLFQLWWRCRQRIQVRTGTGVSSFTIAVFCMQLPPIFHIHEWLLFLLRKNFKSGFCRAKLSNFLNSQNARLSI